MIPIQVTYILSFLFYIASVLIHILVLYKRIDFRLVNGGRSKDFVEQQKLSRMSIIIISTLSFYILLTLIFPSLRSTMVYLIITSIITSFWLLGTVMQLLGTKFERKVVFWINLVGLVSHIFLVLQYFM